MSVTVVIKLADLSVARADALRGRGVSDLIARLTAEAGTAVFKVAFQRWIVEPGQRDLSQLVRECLDTLGAVGAGR
ncbi:hypothetical protein GCM10010377_33310 [Streptomyces viridiviolaceus]|uniref:Uncharacterized protein n=1 Tax=Streptomyces viridiviolaceus TaxID=68282 RepID=A0ABW2EE14_9ACTN|nr:hypothetical protein [Streptomyces viridiviolaceus]GHB39803.1 hypothetical protein GCM10010377_33310 [Streptomyces viridiviolaceus]